MKTELLKISIIIITTILLATSCNQDPHSVSSKLTSTEVVSEASSAPNAEIIKDETNRVTIKTADINIQVQNVQEEVASLQQKINSLNGHIHHYEIKNEKEFQQQINTSEDTSCNIYNVTPVGMLKVKIPRANAQEFITHVLTMKGELSTFLLNEQDITEDIEATKDLTNMYGGIKNKPNQKTNPTIANSEEYIQQKKELNQQTYKSNYLWFDINMQGHKYIYKESHANAHHQRSPLWYSFTESVKTGAYFLIDIVLGFLKIWPALLVLLVGWILVRKYTFNKKHALVK